MFDGVENACLERLHRRSGEQRASNLELFCGHLCNRKHTEVSSLRTVLVDCRYDAMHEQ